jgi:dihydropteroate synthase
MGIVNVTPDSFSDGGSFYRKESAIRRAHRLIEQGADLIDIGGESTRPGADPVSEEEENRRVLPVIERLAKTIGSPISVDTTKAGVARRAIEAGATVVNDISALRFDPTMAETVQSSGCGLVLMHMKGTPRTMQRRPIYHRSVVEEVFRFLRERLDFARSAGIRDERIVLDPGIGFGKTPRHNLQILHRLHEFLPLGRPLLVGPSRKSFIGKLLDLPPSERLEGTAAAVAAAVLGGARVLRIHDVREMSRVARVAEAIRRESMD